MSKANPKALESLSLSAGRRLHHHPSHLRPWDLSMGQVTKQKDKSRAVGEPKDGLVHLQFLATLLKVEGCQDATPGRG